MPRAVNLVELETWAANQTGILKRVPEDDEMDALTGAGMAVLFAHAYLSELSRRERMEEALADVEKKYADPGWHSFYRNGAQEVIGKIRAALTGDKT